jgi:hypothetical protein
VDCEEKQWHGEPVQRSAKATEPPRPAPAIASVLGSSEASAVLSMSAAPAGRASQGVETDDKPPSSDSLTQPASREQMPVKIRDTGLGALADRPAVENIATETTSPGLFFGAGMESQSWWAANKYVLAAVSIVGIVIAVIVWVR